MPVITRLSLEQELSVRDGALLTFVGIDAAPTGSNPTYGSGIAFAVQAVGGVTPQTPGQVTDTDLQAIDPSRFYALADVAEYRVIKIALLSFTRPNETAADRQQQWGDLRKQYQDILTDLERQYAAYLNVRRNPTLVGKTHTRWPTPWSRHWAIGRGRFDH